MPLHRFFVPKGLYTPADKAALSLAITTIYTGVSLPAFYVVVLFIELEPGNIFVGGNATDRMVRIGIEHLARHFVNETHKHRFMNMYETAIAPFTKARRMDWEVQVSDCDRSVWNINGMAPPEANTEGEEIWRRENRAVTLKEIEAMRRASQPM
ncbi:putative oxalocrotonate tautomerase [Mycena polygramma]|nr:putative oxalocrotonate tautomerase [Mycena polygramma]